jgi:alkylation response protein AidB-like acyl-CoA dehydrogenase
MRFAFSEEQSALKREARKVFERPHDWETIASLGWPALTIPEEYGGAGLGWVELCAILEESGRMLSAAPLFSSCVATDAIVALGTEAQKRELLPAIAEGRARASLVLEEGWALDGMTADWFVFVEGLLAPASSVKRTELPTLDATRPMTKIERIEAQPLAANSFERVMARACIALAAEQVGGAERCLERSVEYAKTRQQFGRAIGSFQAIKHMCADMLVRVESARSACYWAAWAASVEDEDLVLAAALAKAWCSEAFFRNSADNIQIHGGIGFTWEHDAHLYFRRARASASLFGDATQHREMVAKRIGL